MAVRNSRKPPSVPGWLLQRSGFTNIPAVLQKATAEHGPVVRFRNALVLRDVFFVNEPAAVEEVLVSKAASFVKGRGTVRLRRLLGNGLLTAERPEHLPHRRLVQPAFHRKRLDAYARVMTSVALGALARWGDGQPIDVDRETNRIALEIAAEALFGADLRNDIDTIADSLASAMAGFPRLMLPFSELFDHVPLPANVAFRANRKKLDDVVWRMIAAHRADGADRGDVLSMLLGARDDESGALDDEQIRDEAMTILLAGHETTANALAWTFYLLQRHPDVEAKLLAHIDDVLDGRAPTIDDVPKLGYVRAVLSEVMRLYPPAWITGRRATAAVDVGGYRMRAGDVALVSQYVMHRSARYWPDPDRFDPERFVSPSQRPPFAYFPFGGGTRICIGESFAWTEGIIVLATILSRVRLERRDAADVETLPLVTLRPRSPIHARVRARASR